ncbi:restriction endonuclease subunit S [Corallococcus sicarius]|nr:restriction endonuclease subunit S [Corallococcus sicarius]
MSAPPSAEALPINWQQAELAEIIIDGPTNGYSPVSSASATGTATLKLSSTTTGEMILNPDTTKRIHETIPSDSNYWLRNGDLLIQRSNTLEYVGAAAIYDGPENHYIYPDLMMRVRISNPITRRFVWRYINSQQAKEHFRARATGTAGNMPKINGPTVRALPVPLPPLAEQQRIVAKLEALLARNRHAREALDAIPSLLERLRQSTLDFAFCGDITKSWRSGQPEAEPANKLLEHIRAARRRSWEERQIKKMQCAGKLPKNDSWKARYEPPLGLEGISLPPLPRGWCWASFDEVTLNFDGDRVPIKSEERKSRQGEHPYYGASGIIDSIDSHIFDGEFLLVAEDGANLLSRSTPIAFLASGQFWVNNHAHVVQTPENIIPLKYLAHYLNSIDLSHFITGSAQPKLTQNNLNKIPIAIAPQKEQIEIVNLLDEVLLKTETINQTVTNLRGQIARFERAALARAFCGDLVPQDPNDEPASVLLERIRAEREAAASTPKQRRSSKATSHTNDPGNQA